MTIISSEHNEEERFIASFCFSRTIYSDSRVADLVKTWQMEDFPPLLVFKKNNRVRVPGIGTALTKIHCDNRQSKMDNFSGTGPAALVSSDRIRQASKSDFFCFFAIFQVQILHWIHSWHKLLYLQTFNFSKRKTKPRIRTKKALQIPNNSVGSDRALCSQCLPCSHLRECPAVSFSFPCPYRISISWCFCLIFKFGVSTFSEGSIWFPSFL